MLDELMEKEKKDKKERYENKIVEANIMLIDKLKWIKEDIQREIYKLKNEEVEIKEIINDLESILKNNN